MFFDQRLASDPWRMRVGLYLGGTMDQQSHLPARGSCRAGLAYGLVHAALAVAVRRRTPSPGAVEHASSSYAYRMLFESLSRVATVASEFRALNEAHSRRSTRKPVPALVHPATPVAGRMSWSLSK